jgi:5-methylcytosine-specific restriction endonuclease McrA
MGLSVSALQHKREYNKQYKLRKKQEAIELLGGKCVSCGSVERLQFDHINNDRQSDKMTITFMIITTSWSRVLEELKKCQLLCFPCHIKKSKQERGHTGIHKHGTTSKYRLDKCRCDSCREVHSLYMKQWHNSRKAVIV